MEELFIEWWDGEPRTIKIFITNFKNGNRKIEFFTEDFVNFGFNHSKSKAEQVLEFCASGMNSPWTGEIFEGFIKDELDRFDSGCRYIYNGVSIVYDSIYFRLYGYGDTKEEAIADYKEKFNWLNTFLDEEFYKEDISE